MTDTMPRQKSNALAFESSHHKRIGRIAERRLDPDFFNVRQLRHLIQTAAADDAEAYFEKLTHERSFPPHDKESPQTPSRLPSTGKPVHPDRDRTNTANFFALPPAKAASSRPASPPDRGRNP